MIEKQMSSTLSGKRVVSNSSLSFAPLEMSSYLALPVAGLAALALFTCILIYLIRPGAPTGFMTPLTVILLLGGIQVLCLAIIGDYLAREFEEVKRRPHFLLKSVLNDPRRASKTE